MGRRKDIYDIEDREYSEEEISQKSGRVKSAEVFGFIALVVGMLLVIGALVYLCYILWQYHQSRVEYDKLEKIVFQVEDIQEVVPGTPVDEEQEEDEQSRLDIQVQEALRELKEQNGDIVGWIAFENLDLSYPVMYSGDDVYYLDHTFSREVNSSGSIFMEEENRPNFEDYHTILYGHNMKNLSMFGRLKYYKQADFYEGHEYFTIYTDGWAYRYQIFSYYDISESDSVYTVGFGADDTYQKFLNQMISRAYYDTGVDVTSQDKVITLSTCSSEGIRFVVHAKRIETRKIL